MSRFRRRDWLNRNNGNSKSLNPDEVKTKEDLVRFTREYQKMNAGDRGLNLQIYMSVLEKFSHDDLQYLFFKEMRKGSYMTPIQNLVANEIRKKDPRNSYTKD